MTIRTALASIALAACAVSVNAQQLWQSAITGMSPEQVITAFPGATVVTPRPSRGSATIRVELAGVEIAGRKFTAMFSFDAGRLVSVDLDSGDLGGGYASTRTALVAALRTKYGDEVTTRRYSVIDEVVWTSGQTTIALIGIVGDRLSIYYSGTVAKDAAKL